MKKLICSLFILAGALAYSQEKSFLEVTSYKLDNGLTVWINEDHTTPTAYGAVVVRAGARDCPSTGIAHYFEHMMFKGTDKIGTIDYEAEKPYLDSIAAMYDKLALAREDEERTGIQKEINRLSIAASKYVIPNEFDALTTLCGGSGLNAYTSQDETVFHSGFLPQFFEQWAEINSERLMNPVFRLFQSELETVYEEKNMYSDNTMRSAIEKATEEFFKGTPYEYSVIGTTQNLKNPQLSQMREFFEKYYVASNMGLILCGDINTEAVKPVIEKTFGRIRKGKEAVHEQVIPQPLQGRQEKEILIDIPVIKLEALCYRTPVAGEKDSDVMQIISNMLQNAEGVGMLDKLAVDRKIMEAAAINMSYQKAGGTAILIVPKIVGQSLKSAEAEVVKVIDKLRKGEFDDSFLESCKQSYKKMTLKNLEDKESRVVYSMADIMSRGRTWEEELERISGIDAISKEDIMRVAGRYFGDDCMVFIKKTGSNPKDNLKKPPYEQVVPQSKDSTSFYAASLKEDVAGTSPRIPHVDFAKDVTTTVLAPKVRLFSAPNPFNDVFELKFEFLTGTLDIPAYERMTSYVSRLGTNGMTYDDLYSKLQRLGGSVFISESKNCVSVKITGLDENLEETLELACSIFKDIKADKKKLSAIKDEETTEKNMNRKDISTINTALFQKTVFGENSYYLRDMGKLDSDYLLSLWSDLPKHQFDILYTGNVSTGKVAELIKEHVDVDAATIDSDAPKERQMVPSLEQEVIFIDKPGSAQAIVSAIILTDKLTDMQSRARADVYDSYLGGGMTSLMFQEIREFRSMAYSTGSAMFKSDWKNRNEVPGGLLAMVGTQNDKAVEAMHVVDSLIRNLPVKPGRFELNRNEIFNGIFYDYPSFREIPAYVQSRIMSGLDSDPAIEKAREIKDMDESDLKAFSEEFFEGRPVVWCVVGNAKKIDMEGLKAYGPVKIMKIKDVMK